MPSQVVRGVLVLVAALGWLAGPASADRAAAATGAWTWPLAGPDAVSRPFVRPPHPYGVGHRGADLTAAPGAAVAAAGAGRVAYAGLLAGRGVVVVVHGALRTTYEPVTATVAVETRVAAGEVIGRLDAGHAGCPAAACLHWGLRRGEDYLDPVRLVEPGPVRLLPVGPLRAGPLPVDPPVGPLRAGPLPVGPRRVLEGPVAAPLVSGGHRTAPVADRPGTPSRAAGDASGDGSSVARLDAPAAVVALSAGAALIAVAVRRGAG